MFKRHVIYFASVVLLCVLFIAESVAQESITYGKRIVIFGDSEHDIKLKNKFNKWYEKQIEQDCKGALKYSSAITAVKHAFEGNKGQYVHGPKDPFNRRENVDCFSSRNNPLGEGVIVHGWIDINKEGSADYHRKRYVWLVLDQNIYPLHSYASGALARLYDGLPSLVESRAGLKEPKKNSSYLDQIGLEADSFIRFQAGSGGSPFPLCNSND